MPDYKETALMYVLYAFPRRSWEQEFLCIVPDCKEKLINLIIRTNMAFSYRNLCDLCELCGEIPTHRSKNFEIFYYENSCSEIS